MAFILFKSDSNGTGEGFSLTCEPIETGKHHFNTGCSCMMISVDYLFVFLRLLVFALLLLYATKSMWKLYFTFLMC